ncbi:hypothetical protein NDU88_004972 [Pleurodeles waltl]|uniref:Uncharacterized protein n=1 Tax=Pleurodeles waltl TaxID=8319 RepID=A0AAV7RMZ1_PLEWA|nr:hypothetical protein NDU88_004972 [Pleurodeles waltl]
MAVGGWGVIGPGADQVSTPQSQRIPDLFCVGDASSFGVSAPLSGLYRSHAPAPGALKHHCRLCHGPTAAETQPGPGWRSPLGSPNRTRAGRPGILQAQSRLSGGRQAATQVSGCTGAARDLCSQARQSSLTSFGTPRSGANAPSSGA